MVLIDNNIKIYFLLNFVEEKYTKITIQFKYLFLNYFRKLLQVKVFPNSLYS
jgi:hypothetical protein